MFLFLQLQIGIQNGKKSFQQPTATTHFAMLVFADVEHHVEAACNTLSKATGSPRGQANWANSPNVNLHQLLY